MFLTWDNIIRSGKWFLSLVLVCKVFNTIYALIILCEEDSLYSLFTL